MIIIYTTPSCSSCRKAKKWLDDFRIKFDEKNIFNHSLTIEDVDHMLERAENGFDDIISTRSKVFKSQKLDVNEMRVSELKTFIIENPSVLKRPIMIEGTKMQVGYNDEEIRVFIPKRLRDMIMDSDLSSPDNDYTRLKEAYFRELDEEERIKNLLIKL